MRSTTSNFDTEHAKTSGRSSPVVIIEISGVTRKYCSDTFNNITANHKKYIKSFSMKSTKSGIPFNNIDFGEARFTIIDDSSLDVATQIQANIVSNNDVTIKIGYAALNDTDFISFSNWYIEEIQPLDSDSEWEFICRDSSKLIATTIEGTQGTTLNGDVAAGATSIILTSASGFIDPASIPGILAENIIPAIEVNGKEIYTYGGISTNTLTSTSGVSELKDGQAVKQALVFIGSSTPPLLLKLVLHILLTGGSNHAYYDLVQASSDNGFKGFGCNMASTDVDIEGIEALDTLLYSTSVTMNETAYSNRVSGSHILRPGTNAFEWITDILNSIGCYLHTNDGKVGIKTYDEVDLRTSFSSVASFDDDNIYNFSYKIEWRPMNTIKMRNYYDLSADDYTKEYRTKLDDSITSYAQADRPYEIETPVASYTDSNDANWFRYVLSRRWLYVFANPWAIATFNAEDFNYEVGDQCDFTLTRPADLRATPSYGWTSRSGLIVGGADIELNLNGWNCKYQAFIWDILDELTGFTTTKATITSFDDSALVNGGSGAALAAEDAYVDLGTPAPAHAYLVTIQWTNPNTGAGEHNLFAIDVHVQATAGVDFFTRILHPRIRYSTNDGNTITRSFYVIDETLPTTNISRIKLDMYNLIEIDGSTSVAGADVPQSVTLTEIKRIDLEKTISDL